MKSKKDELATLLLAHLNSIDSSKERTQMEASEDLAVAAFGFGTMCYNLALEDAVKVVQMLYHDGRTKENHPTKHHQQGADNIQVDKQSILNLVIK